MTKNKFHQLVKKAIILVKPSVQRIERSVQ